MGYKYQKNPEILAADMNGETVMMEIQGGKYYSIGEIGGYIWKLLVEPISIDDLVDKLICEYDVERAQCKTDVEEFIEELKKRNLINTVE